MSGLRIDHASVIETAPATRHPGMPSAGELATLLSNAPHRLMFFAGANAVIVSMLWWACVLAGWRYGWAVPQASVPAGWAHAVLTQYGMLAMFIFGFLLTVLPRWTNQAALQRHHYVPVFVGVFGGYLLAHAGLLGKHVLLVIGVTMMLAGFLTALGVLGRVLWINRARDQHALSTYAALLIGTLGLALFLAFVLGASPRWALVAIKLGSFGLLLPIYFTVCHRMIPFFSASAVADYRVVKPGWSLPLLWLLLAAHVGIELAGAVRWRWLADCPLALFFAWNAVAWQPWKARRSGLLAVLHLALMWLPLAFALYALQSLALFVDGSVILGRMPAHVLTVGYFGSMLVAMVTRVTQGHSGRPLAMSKVAWISFIALQGVVLMRAYAEIASDQTGWMTWTAFAWVAAFLPWVARSLWIYLTPRADGKPG